MSYSTKKVVFLFVCIILTFSFVLPVLAKKDQDQKVVKSIHPLPLNGLMLKIVPKNIQNYSSDIGSKTVNVEQKSDGSLKVYWATLAKELFAKQPYQHYKIAAGRGEMTIASLQNQNVFYLPELWGKEKQSLSDILPLWISPNYLKLSKRAEAPLSLGILQRHPTITKSAGHLFFEKLGYVQNLFEYADSGKKTVVGLKSSQTKDIKNFVQDFFKVRRIAKIKADIYVNGVKQNHPAVIIGNDYYNLVVLDNSRNPLVVSFRMFTKKVPGVFQDAFQLFKKHFEYNITQISYDFSQNTAVVQ